MHLLVIGGSDAGIETARRARELDPAVVVTVVVADRYPNFSICGLPYYLSGDVPDWRALAHRSVADLEQTGMRLLLDHTARAIDPVAKQVTGTDTGGREWTLGYDRLVVATGAEPVRPPIKGLDLPGVHVLHTMADSFAVQQALTSRQPTSAVIIGSGYIGLEMAEALAQRGVAATIVEQLATVMPNVDPELGGRIREELERAGVRVVNHAEVKAIRPHQGGLLVVGTSDLQQPAELVLVVVGVAPNGRRRCRDRRPRRDPGHPTHGDEPPGRLRRRRLCGDLPSGP